MDAVENYKNRLIESGDLNGAIHFCVNNMKRGYAAAREEVYNAYYAAKGLPRPTEKYVGYYSDEELPYKPGMKVTLPKGTIIKETTPGKEGTRATKMTYTITVNHILNGNNQYISSHGIVPSSNPSLRWAGSGGYWSEVDINQLVK